MTTGHIRTPFDQPYTADRALYDVEVRYFDEKAGQCQFALYVRGVQKGLAWQASKDSGEWMTHTISNVTIGSGDEIMVEIKADAGEYGKLDYVQLNYKGSSLILVE
jgi:hypothetical protein